MHSDCDVTVFDSGSRLYNRLHFRLSMVDVSYSKYQIRIDLFMLACKVGRSVQAFHHLRVYLVETRIADDEPREHIRKLGKRTFGLAWVEQHIVTNTNSVCRWFECFWNSWSRRLYPGSTMATWTWYIYI